MLDSSYFENVKRKDTTLKKLKIFLKIPFWPEYTTLVSNCVRVNERPFKVMVWAGLQKLEKGLIWPCLQLMAGVYSVCKVTTLT